MVRGIKAFNIPQYQRSPGKQAACCFQDKTFGVAFAHFLDHCVGFVLRRTQSQHGLTTEQQGGLKGFPHYVVGIVFDQFQRMFAVKSAHHQFHLRAVVPSTFDNACRGFLIIHTNNDGAGVMGTSSVQYFMAGTIAVIDLESIGCHGADDLRIYINDGNFRSLGERCLAGNLPHSAKTDDEYIALQVVCGFHTVHGNGLHACKACVQQYSHRRNGHGEHHNSRHIGADFRTDDPEFERFGKQHKSKFAPPAP